MAAPRRGISAKAVRYELLVFAEGQVTEEQYLKHYHRRNRRRVNVEIHEFHGTPMALVKRAIDAKKKNERAQKRGGGRSHDEVWCVFDVDEHHDLKQAATLAREHGIHVAISNPCIELWFLLHFEPQTAFIDRHDVQEKAREHTKCRKALSESALGDLEANYADAKSRAQDLDDKHRGDGTEFPENNPSSGVWKLVDSIER
jgi:hypothetical protein